MLARYCCIYSRLEQQREVGENGRRKGEKFPPLPPPSNLRDLNFDLGSPDDFYVFTFVHTFQPETFMKVCDIRNSLTEWYPARLKQRSLWE